QRVFTDVSGVETVVFRAFAQGITCWINANAGVTARFHVFTDTQLQVGIEGETIPGEPRPGQDFTFNASPKQGVYPIYEADVTAKVVPITISATITPESGKT